MSEKVNCPRCGDLEIEINRLESETNRLNRDLAEAKQFDELYMTTVDAGRQRACDILKAGNYENVDHAAQKAMDRIAELEAENAKLLADKERLDWLDSTVDNECFKDIVLASDREDGVWIALCEKGSIGFRAIAPESEKTFSVRDAIGAAMIVCHQPKGDAS